MIQEEAKKYCQDNVLNYGWDGVQQKHIIDAFVAGSDWQRQHSYTEEQIKQAILDYCDENGMDDEEAKEFVDDFINNFLNTIKKGTKV